jgi:hypothetical protein
MPKMLALVAKSTDAAARLYNPKTCGPHTRVTKRVKRTRDALANIPRKLTAAPLANATESSSDGVREFTELLG